MLEGIRYGLWLEGETSRFLVFFQFGTSSFVRLSQSRRPPSTISSASSTFRQIKGSIFYCRLRKSRAIVSIGAIKAVVVVSSRRCFVCFRRRKTCVPALSQSKPPVCAPGGFPQVTKRIGPRVRETWVRALGKI